MTTHEQIVKAIGTHGLWKTRLQKAIDQGVSDISAGAAGQDNQCDFGKWLYSGDLSAQARSSQYYQQCRDLHKQFHLEAAKVLGLALSNKKVEASRAIGLQSEFANCSAALTKAMMDWDKERS